MVSVAATGEASSDIEGWSGIGKPVFEELVGQVPQNVRATTWSGRGGKTCS